MGIKDSLKGRHARDSKTAVMEMMIEQKFDKYFYLKKKPKEELLFLENLMNRDGERQERYGLHASAMLESDNMFCYREQVLSLFFKQLQDENVKPGLKRIYDNGNAIHEKWQRLFIRAGNDWRSMDRSRFNKKFDLSFTPDAVLDIESIAKILGQPCTPVEIKGYNCYQYKPMFEKHSVPKAEKQLMEYMGFLRVERGILLIENKNTQEYFIKIVEMDKEKMRPIYNRLVTVQEYKETFLENGRLPKRVGICKDADCKRALDCNMRDACWKVGMGRVKL